MYYMIPENHKKLGIEVGLPILHNAFPDEDLGYFLLGNWFTDLSQGIAPVDYAAGMTKARKEKVNSFMHAELLHDAESVAETPLLDELATNDPRRFTICFKSRVSARFLSNFVL